MNNQTLYRQFLQQETSASLAGLLHETGTWGRLRITGLELVADGRLPYLLATLGPSTVLGKVFLAAMVGVFFGKDRLGPLASELRSDLFYLPFIARPEGVSPEIRALFSADLALGHELIHLEDLLHWIGEEPGFPDRAARHTFEACTRETLEESLDLEIEKLFRLEPRAIGSDFEHGEKLIVEVGPFGLLMQYSCQTKEELITHKVAAMVDALANDFRERFPSAGQTIDRAVRRSLLRYGTALFGPDPETRLRSLQDELLDKLLDGTVAAIDASRRAAPDDPDSTPTG